GRREGDPPGTHHLGEGRPLRGAALRRAPGRPRARRAGHARGVRPLVAAPAAGRGGGRARALLGAAGGVAAGQGRVHTCGLRPRRSRRRFYDPRAGTILNLRRPSIRYVSKSSWSTVRIVLSDSRRARWTSVASAKSIGRSW